jgi:predicted nucleic acid-binding protein
VIADSSPFIHLSAIGRVDLLRDLYGQIIMPPAVWQEVVVAGQGRPGEIQLRQAVGDG